jgi:anti-anti-sigma factor
MHVRVHRDQPGVVRVRLLGDLDIATDATLRQALETELAQRPPLLVIDASDLRFMAAAGVRTLVDAWRAGRTLGVKVCMESARPQVAAVLWITGVWDVLCDGPLPAEAAKFVAPGRGSTRHGSPNPPNRW